MLRWKDTVNFNGIQPVMFFAAQRVADEYYAMGVVDCWITSANDSKHMDGSLHYVGRAMDFRTSNVLVSRRQELATRVKLGLGPQFDVILEDFGGPNEHLHVEFQPKK